MSFDEVDEYVSFTVKTFVVAFGLLCHEPITLSRNYLTLASRTSMDDEVHGCVLGECERIGKEKITIHFWIVLVLETNQKLL